MYLYNWPFGYWNGEKAILITIRAVIRALIDVCALITSKNDQLGKEAAGFKGGRIMNCEKDSFDTGQPIMVHTTLYLV